MQECAVCFQSTTDTLAPCSHPVCATCAEKWFVAQNHVECPLCRGVVVKIPTKDDTLNTTRRGVTTKTVLLDNNRHEADSEEHHQCHVGFTLSDAWSTEGVRVVRLHPNDEAISCGIRIGDVITHMNGLPVHHHQTAVAIADRAANTRTNLICTVKRNRTKCRVLHPVVRRLFG